MDGSGTERIDFELCGEFDKVTEWHKDAFVAKERHFASNMLDYLECAKILHAEDPSLDE